MSDDRDLAEAIHHEILSAASINDALNVWHYEADEPSERQRMWLVLQHVTAAAIVTVLARRQSEAARTGPWGDYEEEDGYPGSLLPRKRGEP